MVVDSSSASGSRAQYSESSDRARLVQLEHEASLHPGVLTYARFCTGTVEALLAFQRRYALETEDDFDEHIRIHLAARSNIQRTRRALLRSPAHPTRDLIQAPDGTGSFVDFVVVYISTTGGEGGVNP